MWHPGFRYPTTPCHSQTGSKAGVGTDSAAVDSDMLGTGEPGGETSLDYPLEHGMHQRAITEAAVAVFGKA